jgi:hypothetical protein
MDNEYISHKFDGRLAASALVLILQNSYITTVPVNLILLYEEDYMKTQGIIFD